MSKITLINLLIIITGITALSSAAIYKHYLGISDVTVSKKPLFPYGETVNEAILEELVNKEKEQPLVHNEALCSFAQSRLEYMSAKGFGHEGFQQTPKEYFIDNNLMFLGENLVVSSGKVSNEQLVWQWMNSPTHKANILDPRFTQTCVKCDSKYCVQIFAEPRPTNP